MDLAAENKELREKLESRTRDSEELNIELLCLEGRNKELREKLRIEEEAVKLLSEDLKNLVAERKRLRAEIRELQERIDEITMYIPKIGEKSKSYAELLSENRTLVQKLGMAKHTLRYYARESSWVTRMFGVADMIDEDDLEQIDVEGFDFNMGGKVARNMLEKLRTMDE